MVDLLGGVWSLAEDRHRRHYGERVPESGMVWKPPARVMLGVDRLREGRAAKP
jgi:hypothetical protein